MNAFFMWLEYFAYFGVAASFTWLVLTTPWSLE